MPFILLFALYVLFHGDYGPGGGFQAGVIFASGVRALRPGVRAGPGPAGAAPRARCGR